jgi:hypothetical protein
MAILLGCSITATGQNQNGGLKPYAAEHGESFLTKRIDGRVQKQAEVTPLLVFVALPLGLLAEQSYHSITNSIGCALFGR